MTLINGVKYLFKKTLGIRDLLFSTALIILFLDLSLF